jgi:hypothetical protein
LDVGRKREKRLVLGAKLSEHLPLRKLYTWMVRTLNSSEVRQGTELAARRVGDQRRVICSEFCKRQYSTALRW